MLKIRGIAVVAMTLATTACGSESRSAVTASGYVEVDGQHIELTHADVQAAPWGWILSLTDRALDKGCVGATSSLAMMESGVDFTGIDLSVQLPTRSEPTGVMWFAHPDLSPAQGRGLFSATTPVAVNDGLISGVYEQSSEADGKRYRVHVEFGLPSDGDYAPRLELSGGGGAPAAALAEMLAAWLAGDVDGVRARSTADVAARIDELRAGGAEAELAQTLIGFADMMFMERMQILKSDENGDTATLQLSGSNSECRQADSTARGTVALVRESGVWKVGSVDWASVEES